MTLELRQLHPLFAAEADGIDLAQPIDAAMVDAIWRGDRPLRRAGVSRPAA